MTIPCCSRMAYDLNQTCDLHVDRAACPDAMIAEADGGFGLYVRDGEEGYAASTVEIGYCPWCGTKLSPVGDIDLTALPEEDFAKGSKLSLHPSSHSQIVGR